MNEKPYHEQGVCQALRCPQCRAPYPFAPGVVERQPSRRRWYIPAVAYAVLMLALLLALVMLAGFVLIGNWLSGGAL